MSDFERVFRDKFRRSPSKDDLKKVVNHLPAYESSQTSEAGFNATITEIKEAGRLSDQDVAAAIEQAAAEDRAAQQRAADKASLVRRVVWTLVILVGAGTGAGLGFATYTTIREPAVVEAKQMYDDKKAALDKEYKTKNESLQKAYADQVASLENKFYGPLPALLAPNAPCALSVLERELYAAVSLTQGIRDKLQHDNVIFDKQVDGVHVTARTFGVVAELINTGRGQVERVENYLVVEKRDDKGLCSMYIYDMPAPGVASIQYATPRFFLILSGQQARTVDFPALKIKVTENNKTLFNGADGIEVYRKLGVDILSDFKSLYARGSN